MTFKHIVSRDNLVFKELKRLADNARERHSKGKTLLDGVHLIDAYMAIYGDPELIIIPEGKSNVASTSLIQKLEHVSTVMMPTLMFGELTPVASATGILALVKIPRFPIPEQPSFILMLEDIQDPGNLGSMFRTAAAAGIEAIYLSVNCTDAWSPKALRGGQGAHFLLPIIERTDLIEQLKIFNGNSYATTLQGESLYSQDLSLPTAFIIGNEGAGLTSQTMNAATKCITIPMQHTRHGTIESLNAGAATAVCLFEHMRQKILLCD